MEKILSEEFSPVNIDGYFSPFAYNDQPHLVELPDNPNKWIVVFSNVDALKKSCEFLNIKDYKIKRIDDGLDFIDSLKPYGIRVMANPYVINGNTRWTEVLGE